MRSPLPLSSGLVVALRVSVLATLVAGVVAAGVLMPHLQAHPQTPLAAVFPPWWSNEAVLSAAARSGVAIMGQGVAPNVLIVSANSMTELGGLYRNGVWSVITTTGLADCLAAFDGQGT